MHSVNAAAVALATALVASLEAEEEAELTQSARWRAVAGAGRQAAPSHNAMHRKTRDLGDITSDISVLKVLK